MIKNYLKIAWRNLVKGKLYSIINITGLAVGIACCFLIGLYVYNELRYDHFHEKADRIYRINHTTPAENGRSKIAQTPKPLAPFLEENISEIEHAIRLQKEDGIIRIENELFKEQFLVAENGFLDIFSFNLIQGNPGTAFSEREQIILTESYARKLFGSNGAMGRSLELRINGEYYQATVGGILEDPPGYSSISFNIVIPLEYWKKVDSSYQRGNNWGTLRPATYVMLNPETNYLQVADKIDQELTEQLSNYSGSRIFELQPLTDIHFDNSVEAGLGQTANVNFIYISVIIAALILIIACINFMSISIGQSTRRAREIGMRKAMGARRMQVMKQFLGETILVVLFSLALGLLLTELILPFFNMMIGKSLALRWMETPFLLIMVMGTIIITGLLAGSYPALYLSKFEPSQIFRNKIQIEGKHVLIRSLSGIQFALAITLITGTLFMNQQMDLLLNKSLGFDEEFVVQVEVPFEEGKDIVSDLQSALRSETLVQHVSGTWETIGDNRVEFQAREVTSGDQKITGYGFGAGPELVRTMGFEIIRGRDVRKNSGTNAKQEVLVNRELVEAFGWENPIGKKISRRLDFQNAEIVGVINDFHFQSLHHPVGPLVIHPVDYYTMTYIRLEGGQIKNALENIKAAWNKAIPGLPFNYSFLDQKIEQQYKSDIRWVQIVQFASCIAIILACMGLFGLATLSTTKRAKEIGIRKVLGATAFEVTTLLSIDFLKPVAVALFVAIPVSYLLISHWLQNFAYKTDLGLLTYFSAIIITVGIALTTVSWQSIRAALANPVDSLRSE